MKKGKWEKGNEVYWTDPEGTYSGWYEVVEKLTSRDVESMWKIKSKENGEKEVIQTQLKSKPLSGYGLK